MSQYADHFLIFLHIQKTAGLSMQHILRHAYGPGPARRFASRYLAGEKAHTLREAMQSKTKGDGYFAGHFCFGAHRYLPSPSTYICFLRDPVKRLLSLYNYSVANSTAYYHSAAKGKTAEGFLLHTQLMELDNGQARFLAGDPHDLFINRTPFGECDDQLLSEAKSNLDEHVAVVGLTERFDESILMMKAAFGWRSCYYFRRNTSKKKVEQTRISDEVIGKIRDRNWLDRALYEHAVLRFERDYEAMGPSFPKKVEAFQRANMLRSWMLGGAYDRYERTKQHARRFLLSK